MERWREGREDMANGACEPPGDARQHHRAALNVRRGAARGGLREARGVIRLPRADALQRLVLLSADRERVAATAAATVGLPLPPKYSRRRFGNLAIPSKGERYFKEYSRPLQQKYMPGCHKVVLALLQLLLVPTGRSGDGVSESQFTQVQNLEVDRVIKVVLDTLALETLGFLEMPFLQTFDDAGLLEYGSGATSKDYSYYCSKESPHGTVPS